MSGPDYLTNAAGLSVYKTLVLLGYFANFSFNGHFSAGLLSRVHFWIHSTLSSRNQSQIVAVGSLLLELS